MLYLFEKYKTTLIVTSKLYNVRITFSSEILHPQLKEIVIFKWDDSTL